MENIILRIKRRRKEKGYSHETMGHELNISPAAYRKIETNQTKLTVERLLQIVKILDISLVEILNIEYDKIGNGEHAQKAMALEQFSHLCSENREKTAKIESLYEERIKQQTITINRLLEVINNSSRSAKSILQHDQ